MNDFIVEHIKNIYENININKAIFIVNSRIINDIHKYLINDDYPVCNLNEFSNFINNKSRIILIKNTDIDKIKLNKDLFTSLKLINLVIFIETPLIPDKDFYKDYFDMIPSNDKTNNIFQV
jgi:hypothetical protein|tara:strand:- start:360 stop:722 length:363 start_codon:yes stop_codon:yes gene_type:complete